MLTYQLHTRGDFAYSIECGFCGSISRNPGDIQHKYCGRCHLFHHVVAEARFLLTSGATHECGEWRTAREICALCERPLRPGRF
jgi:hypothetical protein